MRIQCRHFGGKNNFYVCKGGVNFNRLIKSIGFLPCLGYRANKTHLCSRFNPLTEEEQTNYYLKNFGSEWLEKHKNDRW